MAAERKTKIAVIVINDLEAVLQALSIYYLHSARSPTLDNIPFWTVFDSFFPTFGQIIFSHARLLASLPLLGFPWIFLCLILDFSGVSRNATDISVVVTFDILAIMSVVNALSLVIVCHRSLTSSDNKEIEKIYFQDNDRSSFTVIRLMCLNVVRYSASKTMVWSWILGIICVVLPIVSNGLTFQLINWEAIKDKKKGMTRSEAVSPVQSEISKAVPSLEKKEIVVAIDAAQPLTNNQRLNQATDVCLVPEVVKEQIVLQETTVSVTVHLQTTTLFVSPKQLN